ncbi:uncharacterized protein LOC125464051 [Stegostoma tigrinum]|uniref:uncharacterized protein LOC125464051 n=1 Tax=Stegostoma tigrinum TaxID=3053191 RepID=UPI00286FE5C5|nr:uncharacterized protein LOC125464051 [Stegostoma tigrinum]XP_048411998.2 uncharacterized protein LOC125464051 [Stegostoma tigrinum]XP_059510983.1 uncharacterized protein LOC125464051 [Stegostoma tigrinum]
MATWVEGKPATTPKNTLSDVNEIVNDTKSPWACLSPLSDARNKALEPVTPVSPHLFDSDCKLNYNLGSVTNPVAGPKPRLTAKPFFLETSAVPYTSLGTTQAPLTPPKPLSVASVLTSSRKLAADTDDAKVSFRNTEAKCASSETVSSALSSFAQKYSVGSDNKSWTRAYNFQDGDTALNLNSTTALKNSSMVASSLTATLSSEKSTEERSECSETKPTTVVILETSVQKLKSKKSSEGTKDAEVCRDSTQDQESPSTLQPFKLSRSSIRSRKYSPSATQEFDTPKPESLSRASSLRCLGKWHQVTEEGQDRMKDSTENPSSPRLHLKKPGLFSAWLLETADDDNSETTMKQDEKPFAAEKPWLKKPRPLSMDLTARFETSAHKRNIPPSVDIKKNVPIIKANSAVPSDTSQGAGVEQEDSAAVAEKCQSSASPNNQEEKTDSCVIVVKDKFDKCPKVDDSEKNVKALPLCDRNSKENITSLERKIAWERDLTDTKITAGQGKEEKEERIFTTSLKTDKEKLEPDHEQFKKWTNKELDKECSDLDRTSNGEISALGSDDQGNRGNKISGGMIKRRITLLLDSAGGNTAKTDSSQSAAETEKIDIPVRQRIQTFTSENDYSKREQPQTSQRRSFKPRPLSSDITKRFETQTIGDEGHHDEQMDMTASSSPDHSILQNTQEQDGRESQKKEIDDQKDMTKNEKHLMDTATEFRWSRRQSVKKVSQVFDNLASDDKTHSEKISRRNTFNRKDEMMKRQINVSSEPASNASMTRVSAHSSGGQKTVTSAVDSDLRIKTVKVSVVENEIQRHKVPEVLHSEDLIQSFDKSKRSEHIAQPELKHYTTLKISSEVMCNDTEPNKTKPLELEAAALGEQRKTHFKSGEERVPRFSVNAPPSSKVTAQNISDLLLPTTKIDVLQDANEKAVSAPPTAIEDKVTIHSRRKSHSPKNQTKLEGNVSGAKGYWNQSLPAESNSTLQTPPTAPNSQIQVAEVLNPIQNQSSHIEVRTPAVVDSDKGEKKNIKKIQPSSHRNTELLLVSKDSFKEFRLKKDDEAANQECLSSAGYVDVKDAKGSNDVEGYKGTRVLQQDDRIKEFSANVQPKEGKDNRKKKTHLEPIFKSSSEDHISDFSPGMSYSKRRYTSELLPPSDSQPVDRSKDVFPEENLRSHPKLIASAKPKITLLTDAFLDMPCISGEDYSSKKSHLTPSTKDPRSAEFEKLRKSKVISRHNRHTILDLDTLMADWGKEMTKSKNKESKSSLYHDKMYNDHSSPWKTPLLTSSYVSSLYNEQSSKKMTQSADHVIEILSSSDKDKNTAEVLNKKHLQHNSVLDLDVLMAEYRKSVSMAREPISSKLAERKSPNVKIQKSSSFTSHEAKTYMKTDRIKDCCDEEIKKDVSDGVPALFKRQSKDGRWKSTPSLAYNEYDKLEKSDLCSNGQKSEGKQIQEMDTLTSTPASLNRWPKHDKMKSRPSSTYIRHGEVEQAKAVTNGLKSNGSREKGKLREEDQSGPKPRQRKNRSEERKLEITPIEKERSPQVFDGHCPDSKTGVLDYLIRPRILVHNSPHFILENEKYVEMSVDDEMCPTVGNRPTVHKEGYEQKSPRVKNEFSKDPKQSVSEFTMSRLLEGCKQIQKAVDSLTEGASNFRGHEGRKNYSTGEAQSRVSETMGSYSVEKEHPPASPSKTQRKIRDMTQLTSKTKKQNEKKMYSRRTVHQEKNQDPKLDRVTQCCISPSTKAKDTDALVQERDQFCSSDEREQYGTCDERGSSANEEGDLYCKYLEHKQSQQENYKSLSPYKEPSSIPAASPRKEHVQSRASLSSQSEMTPSSDQLSFFQDPRNINYGLSSCELESPDDTDSLQSTDPSTQVCPTPQGFSFLEPVTTLDSHVQKSRIQLGRKTLRRAPTKHKKSGFGDQPDGPDQFIQGSDDSWMYKDSTESRPTAHEELVDEEVVRPQKLPISQCPRVAMFPGMDPCVLKASLRRNRAESDNDENESSCEQHCRSCSPPAQQGPRVMPSINNKGEGSDEMPPAWLQELKSKKRLSQHQPDRKNE